MSTTPRPIKPPSDAHLRKGEGIADPSYLLGEIEELRKIAGRAGFGSLEYLLALAEEECREQGKRLTRSAGRSLAPDEVSKPRIRLPIQERERRTPQP